MTIKTRVERAASAKAHGFRYVKADDVAIVSVVGERPNPTVSLTTVLHACVRRLTPLLASIDRLDVRRLLLFVATPFWDQPNALARRAEIWAREDLHWLPADAPRSPTVHIHRSDGSRIAGLARIPESALMNVAEFVRKNRAAVVWLSANTDLDETRVRALFERAFPQGESQVDWASVTDAIAGGEDIVLRISGGFDDREVAIDAFMATWLLQTLDAASSDEAG